MQFNHCDVVDYMGNCCFLHRLPTISPQQQQSQDFYKLKEMLNSPNVWVTSWSHTDGCAGATLVSSEERRWLGSSANVRVIWS